MATLKQAPMGVSALSQPLALQKSCSMPSLPRSAADHDRPGNKALTMTMSSGFHSPQKSLDLAMRATFSPGSSSGFAGRMILKGSWGHGPPKAGAFKKQIPKGVSDKMHTFELNTKPATQFRRFYERHDLPITVRHGMQPSVEWKVEPERLDYMYLLPIFWTGLLERTEPYSFLALNGIQDMLNAARGKEPSVICPVIPSLIMPIRQALGTKDPWTMSRCINMLQLMIRCDPRCGELLVPYYRQILPMFSLYRNNNKNLGDGIEYSQRKRENMGDLIAETLELLERSGGEDAFINIKYMIPTYESCMV
eukprot:TRINITY_DN5475_c0_g4_i1.p1 TRINITY_DN5475_c0_g4~~TRINITY_DN5475_c0_g4_i1.p1  ORF type:complete len:308 (+),score=56.56 TRINITY_DN5475_c0_g4_i1:32-955(+)